MKINHEVLIYVNKVKHHFDKASDKDREYFFDEDGRDVFYKKVEELSNKNFEEKGTVELTKEQFESLKNLKEKIKINKGESWFEHSHIGIIYLN